MKQKYRTAYNQLKKLGVPVYEDNYPTVWADYWGSDNLGLDCFGVNHKINAILEKQGLYAEWENGGVLGVAEM